MRVDQFDTTLGCEAVTRVVARPAGADVIAPKCKLAKGPKKKTTRKKFFKAVSGRLTCNEAASISAKIVARFKRSPKGRSW